MCGIAGVLGPAGAGDRDRVERMVAALHMRGPDASAVSAWPLETNEAVFLGHARLRVVDLSEAAAQPMLGSNEDVAVSFNGEVYNFEDLRSQLEARGHRFRSGGDTEVIVRGYEEWGTGVVERLDGMFSFAIWDGRRRQLLVARDRFGKKPLFYAWDGERFTFASTTRALLASGWVDAITDPAQVAPYLAHGYVPGPSTFLRGVVQLPPASWMIVDRDGPANPVTYWSPAFSLVDGALPRLSEEMVETTRRLFIDAVRSRLHADVPSGVLLSGGVDSSLVVAAMHELGAPINSFTASVRGGSGYDEGAAARRVADHFGARHMQVRVQGEVADLLERLTWFADQPFADSSMIPSYLVARAASDHVTVVLTGDGGDETFGGYERFAAAAAAEIIPVPLQRMIGRASAGLGGDSYFDLGSRIRRFGSQPRRSTLSRYRDWVWVTHHDLLAKLVSSQAAAAAMGDFRRAAGADTRPLPIVHRVMDVNVRGYLPDDLLVKIDRMTMANSLEARSPFLDTALFEYVSSLPTTAKVAGLTTKRLLRRVARRMLPPDVAGRRKHGFGVPIASWLRGPLDEPFRDLVLASDARSGALLDPDVVANLHLTHRAGEDHGAVLWAILCLEMWLRQITSPSWQPPTEVGVELA